MKNPKRIDAENDEFFKENLDNVVKGKMSFADIVGFGLKEPTVFLPRAGCGHLGPSVTSHCDYKGEKTAVSLLTLLPLYNSMIYPIAPELGGTKISEKTFEKANDISLANFVKTVERGRVIPYFTSDYQKYDVNFLEHFLDTGLPRISSSHFHLIRRQNACRLVEYSCEKCKDFGSSALKDVGSFLQKDTSSQEVVGCAGCLRFAYALGIKKDEISKFGSPIQTLCAIVDVAACRNIGAVFQTNCPRCVEVLGVFTGTSPIEGVVESIVEGLKVKYTPDLDFESYLELLDERTTRAIREITNKILKDPFVTKYSEHLNSKIFEFNREVEEVAKTRRAKFYHTISNIAVYGGNKFIERKTEGYVHAEKKKLSGASEWLGSKLMDIHAKIMGKDWTIAQIYRTRCKIEQCKNSQGES